MIRWEYSLKIYNKTAEHLKWLYNRPSAIKKESELASDG